jgi:glycosyltransferase involved in cell wall biosynthesis
MVYPGSFAYPPNAAAAIRLMTDVLGAVRTRGFEARVVLVGREPGAALLAAAARDRDVHVTGAVESVLPYLEQPCVVTLPIDGGSGTRLKILEAFAIGRPVVSTVKGAEGIDAVDGVHLLIRHDARAIADAVIQTWHRRDLRAQLCANALDLVRQRYSWSAATEAIAACLGAPGRPRSLPTPRAQPVRGHDVFH